MRTTRRMLAGFIGIVGLIVWLGGCSKDAGTNPGPEESAVPILSSPPEDAVTSPVDFSQSPDFVFLRPGGDLNGTKINPGHNEITVAAGAALQGTVNIRTENDHGPGAIVPVLYTPTWGNHSTSWVQIGNAPAGGRQDYSVNIRLTAPGTPGTYCLIFGMAGQISGEYLASMSAWWGCGAPVWNDGNDLADLTVNGLGNAWQRGFAMLPEYNCGTGAYTPNPVGLTCIVIRVPGGGEFPVDDHTIALWHFNEATGGALHDATGHGNDGTIYGAAWAPGRFGTALHFDGIDDYVRVAHRAMQDFHGQITIEAWVRLESYHANASFVCKGEATGCYALKEYSPDPGAQKCCFDVGGPWSGYTFVGQSPIALNQWVLLAATYDGTTSRIFVNGVLDRSETLTVPVPTDPFDLYIGADPPGLWDYVNGTIDEVRISDIVRY
jgi:hypothetical protein